MNSFVTLMQRQSGAGLIVRRTVPLRECRINDRAVCNRIDHKRSGNVIDLGWDRQKSLTQVTLSARLDASKSDKRSADATLTFRFTFTSFWFRKYGNSSFVGSNDLR